jgi:hypothetical protein
MRGIRERAKLFYSENRHEEEADRGANHLARDIGYGKEVSGSRAARGNQGVCGVWRFLRSADRA